MNSRQLVFKSMRIFVGYDVSNQGQLGFKKPVVSELLFGAEQNLNAGDKSHQSGYVLYKIDNCCHVDKKL